MTDSASKTTVGAISFGSLCSVHSDGVVIITIRKGKHLQESNESLNYSAVNETNDNMNNAAAGGLRRCKCRFGCRC